MFLAADVAGPFHIPIPYTNEVITLLGVFVDDPDDVAFGTYSSERFFRTWTDYALLFRTDGRAFEREHAEALIQYCGNALSPLYQIGSQRPVGEAREALITEATELMSPEAYAGYWRAHREETIKEGDEGWVDLECPVVSDLVIEGHLTEVCRECGASKANGGGMLLRCGRCRKRTYCSKQCQKADWGKHKRSCGAR